MTSPSHIHSFSSDEKAFLCKVSAETLEKLEGESGESASITSWIQGTELPPSASDHCRFFDNAGFLHLPNFCSPLECQEMKDAMANLVNEHWQPGEQIDSFGTNEAENTARGDYFLESSNNVHYFAEPAAMKDDKLKPEYHDNKLAALNKAGHALHLPSPRNTNGDSQKNPFYSYCASDKIRNLVQDLNWKDPVVPQSMYIFKQPTLGGAVNSHQDSTFLYTTPKQSCLGLWLALDEATLDNGCLWVRPKSHKEAVRRQYKRNSLHFSSKKAPPTETPKFLMKDLYEHSISWDGGLPDDLLKAGFIPVPCRAGDLLVFNGELDHLSLPNTSDKPRHTFQLHLVEGAKAGVQWSPHNWLQYPEGKPFLSLRNPESGPL